MKTKKSQEKQVGIKIITHYPKDDPAFAADYSEIDIIINNKKVVTYGDAYHDSGHDKVKGFVDALQWIFEGLVSVERVNIADMEY